MQAFVICPAKTHLNVLDIILSKFKKIFFHIHRSLSLSLSIIPYNHSLYAHILSIHTIAVKKT